MSKPILLALLTPLFVLPLSEDSCSSSGTPTPEVTPTPSPNEGPNTTVVALSQVHQQFGNGDTRTVNVPVSFPEEALFYQKITMTYTLTCPSGGCDPWDRLAMVQVVKDAGTPQEVAIEVGRYVTPYGVGGSWTVDVTDLRPILAGSRTVRSFIDTWVNPGWLVDVSFDFVGGTPTRRAVQVLPLLSGYVGYGDPNNPPDNHLPEKQVALPSQLSGAKLWVFATGHGFGATENCAEFCQKQHTLVFNGTSDVQIPWRDDCRTAGVPDQSGTFWYSRAGWCPGDDVVPRTWDVSTLVQAGSTASFDYGLQAYTNLETDVSPYWALSAALIIYE